MELKDLLNVILEYTKVLAWPVVVLIVVLVLRPDILSFIRHIQALTIKIKDLFEINAAVRDTKSEASVPQPGETTITVEELKSNAS